MAGFILSTHVLGFIVGSIAYVALVIILSGDRKWVRSLVVGTSTAVIMYLLAKIVHLQLPLGFLEFIR
jgi:ABC-type enterobactin transport system permease subunit